MKHTKYHTKELQSMIWKGGDIYYYYYYIYWSNSNMLKDRVQG